MRWLASRSEGFLTDNQARDTIIEAALALGPDGRFLALDIDVLANMGAYLTSHAAFIATANFARCLPGMYDIAQIAAAHPLPVHQHSADRTLSRRRAPRGELHARTPRRCGGARLAASTGSNCGGAI